MTQVRTEIAYLNYGMLVRHVIDETSPLYQRTPDMLEKEDAIFVLSVVSSLQAILSCLACDGTVLLILNFCKLYKISIS